ncbi:MAG: hypothetical protein LH465_01265 [Sphingomonas bacterium]|nr:hypothetical protein [Sphingomonas bacterium]
MRILVLAAVQLALCGCVTSVAKTAFDVVTLPVKIVSKGVDLATTSQSEADQKRGRNLRRAEEDAGRAARAREKACAAATRRGQACAAADPLAPRAD